MMDDGFRCRILVNFDRQLETAPFSSALLARSNRIWGGVYAGIGDGPIYAPPNIIN